MKTRANFYILEHQQKKRGENASTKQTWMESQAMDMLKPVKASAG